MRIPAWCAWMSAAALLAGAGSGRAARGAEGPGSPSSPPPRRVDEAGDWGDVPRRVDASATRTALAVPAPVRPRRVDEPDDQAAPPPPAPVRPRRVDEPPSEERIGGMPPALPPTATIPPRPSGGGAEAAGPSPLAAPLTLHRAPVDPGDLKFPINLATALRLADARPLVVAAAQARVWVAEASLTHAKVLWIPALNIGFDYIRHDGGGPDFNKGIMTAPSTNFLYAGAGFWGLPLGIVGTTDAIYEPLVARQTLNSEHWSVQTAKNDVLFETASAYFAVHQYRGIFAGALYNVERGRDLVDKIAALGRDLVPAYETDRARNMLADLEQQAVTARQQWRVESARLTRTLRLDPRAVVVPLEHDHTQVTLIDPGRPIDDLLAVALHNRPEVQGRQAMLAGAEIAVRRERARPFIPNIAINGFQTPYEMIQAGIMGFGPNASMNQWRGRDDFSVQPVIQLDSIGIGNLARIKGARGMESLAIIDLFDAQDAVAEQVKQSHARVQSAAARVLQADRALRTGIITLNGATEGLGQTTRFGDTLSLISRPQEAVYALQLLQRAFNEYFTTIADYNRAQFELFRALGYPAQEVSGLRPPGQVLPVDTSRPAYLPAVGNGPPPATR